MENVMPFFAFLILAVSFGVLLDKRRLDIFWKHMLVFLGYGLILTMMAVNAKGWDGLGFLLIGLAAAVIQLITLFVTAMTVDSRKRTAQAPAPQERAKSPTNPKPQIPVVRQAQASVEEPLDRGELPFEME